MDLSCKIEDYFVKWSTFEIIKFILFSLGG